MNAYAEPSKSIEILFKQYDKLAAKLITFKIRTVKVYKWWALFSRGGVDSPAVHIESHMVSRRVVANGCILCDNTVFLVRFPEQYKMFHLADFLYIHIRRMLNCRRKWPILKYIITNNSRENSTYRLIWTKWLKFDSVYNWPKSN